MDPLTALGLASNIVQLMDFSLKLFSEAAEIAGSAAGSTTLHAELTNVYTRLQTFTLDLSHPGRLVTESEGKSGFEREFEPVIDARAEAHSRAMRPHVVAIQQIAADCQDVCGQLLAVVQGLRVDPAASGHRLRSLGVALKAAFRAKKITGLEDRLRRFQDLLALHFLPLLKILWTLKGQNHALKSDQSDRFEKLSGQLNNILSMIQVLTSESGAKAPSNIYEPTPRASCPGAEDVQALGEILNGLSLAEKDMVLSAREQRFLESLNFKARTYRHEAIPEAHKATIEWIFQPEPDAEPDAETDTAINTTSGNFVTWLKPGKGPFWVSGKAGVGKSTLMKFIADHDKTRSALNRPNTGGVAGKKVVIASHYFWSAGTPMQKSLKGLLQELVFDIIYHCPELAHDIFPDRLRMIGVWSAAGSSSGPPGDDNVWTKEELLRGLLTIANHPDLPIRCFFFIDGLDQFSDDVGHIELCQTLNDLTMSGNIKCCVSSRPLNVFEDAFGPRSGRNDAAYLRVHELTYTDIKLFARSRLLHNARWEKMGIGKEDAEWLVCYITDHAQGVFLWVYLVKKSLREGLIDSDTFADLQRRLKVVPTELEPYFKHMLDRIHKVHHGYMAQTLQMALNASEQLSFAAYHVSQ
ncbi:hypothetical protein SCUCBS95973_000794 [Sporothrix curviconia]|uniref:Nephrocystin 3-like N-terminal domain-containing protein n=1 Tax=Sporothrix curviconia TaxID=1260050 RepID=A0ABP0ATB9_9PEZI